MSFKDYKQNRTRLFEESQKQATEAKTKTYEKDPLEWYPTVGKDGNGVAIVRFLPGREVEETQSGQPTNFVKYYTHSFEHPQTGRYYIENSLSTLNPKFDPDGIHDPLMEYNKTLYDSAPKDGEGNPDQTHPNVKQASRQKRSVNYRSNVYIQLDSSNKDNNGQVRKWKFGQSVMNEILEALTPKPIEGVKPTDPIKVFDLVEGASLRIQISTDPTKKFNGKPAKTYKYSWVNHGPLFDDDNKIEEVYNEINNNDKWSLATYIAPDKFKTREALIKRLVYVLGYDPFGGVNPAQEADVPMHQALDHLSPTVAETPKATRVSGPKPDSDFFSSLVAENEEDDIPF